MHFTGVGWGVKSMSLKTTTQIRLGKISYVNTLPFYYRLENTIDHACSVSEGVPTEINSLLQNGQIDLAPISSLAYAQHFEAFYLLPSLCIGSLAHSGSVLLLSKEKIENLNGKRIAVSNESLSSRALLKILLGKRFGFVNPFSEANGSPDEMLAGAAACLAIGDKALFYKPEKFIYKYDLSELWHEWTSLPFCFSVWAVRRKFFIENEEDVRAFWQRMIENTKRNLADVPALVREALKLDVSSDMFAQTVSYLSHLSYDFDERTQKGLLHFFSIAAGEGMILSVPALRFTGEGE